MILFNFTAKILFVALLIVFILVFGIVIVLASFGKTLGLRQKYVELLLWIFEYGRKKIEIAEKKKRYVDRTFSVCEEPPSINLNPQHHKTVNKDQILLNGLNKSVNDELVVTDEVEESSSFNEFKKEFHLSDSIDYIMSGVEAIVDDEVTKRFSAEELPSWNLLTRTNRNYHYISMKLTILWFFGFFLRYCVLLPFRLLLTIVGVSWLVIFTAVIGYLPKNRMKRWIYWHVSLMCFRILSRAFSAIITYHNRENRAKSGGICVANHTSPIDVVILACDNCYAMVGQAHEAFLGIIQRALARATSHVWFERSEVRDRTAVAKRLKTHVEDEENLPMLIFPEGTCINNTSVMMFKKGSFEVGGVIYPVAIKYDPKFGDAFWNSSQQGMVHYLLRMMTSWAIVCDVWYLPPMTMKEGENAITFANRVKAIIAMQGGLVDLMWDGQLKRVSPKPEMRKRQQEEYSKRIKFD